MLSFWRRPASPQLIISSFAIVASALLAFLAIGMAQKGVWFDELWSKWMSSRELGLADAARQRWFQDVHPPLFYLFNWAVSAIVGSDVVIHRWLNFLWVAALAGVGAWIATVRPAMRPSLVVAGLLLLSTRDIMLVGEYRSYALILCASASLILLLGEVIARADDLAWPQDRTLAGLLVVTILVVLNLHYVTTLITGVTIAVFTVDQMRARRWRWAALMAGTAAIAMVFVLAALLAERDYMAAAAPGFWLDKPFRYAVRVVLGKFVYATGFNVVLVACLALAVAQRARLVKARPTELIEPQVWHFVALTLVSIVVSCLALLAINEVKSVIHSRYLSALTPMAIVAVALLVSKRIASQNGILMLFVANSAIVAGWWITSVPKQPAWDAAARLVAAKIKQCPSTLVYTMSMAHAVSYGPYRWLPNDPPFMRWAMMDLSNRYRLPSAFLTITRPGQPQRRSPGGCPTLLWIENVYELDAARTAVRAGLANNRSAARFSVAMTQTGAVLTIPPEPLAR